MHRTDRNATPKRQHSDIQKHTSQATSANVPLGFDKSSDAFALLRLRKLSSWHAQPVSRNAIRESGFATQMMVSRRKEEIPERVEGWNFMSTHRKRPMWWKFLDAKSSKNIARMCVCVCLSGMDKSDILRCYIKNLWSWRCAYSYIMCIQRM